MILDCYKVLKRIEPRPAMFTGENSLKSIVTFLQGYQEALFDHDLIRFTKAIDPFFDWVAHRLGYFESTAGWANMILAYSLGFDTREILWEDLFNRNVSLEEHEKSVRLFYELVEQFKKEMETP